MRIAHELGRFEYEVLDNLTADEYSRWVEYLKIVDSRRSKTS